MSYSIRPQATAANCPDAREMGEMFLEKIGAYSPKKFTFWKPPPKIGGLVGSADFPDFKCTHP